MTANLGSTDRIIRFAIGLCLLIAPLGNLPPVWSSPLWAYGAMAVGVILMVTAMIRFCPLYRLVGVSTCKT